MNEAENIVSQMNYLTPARYISGRIVEYDLHAANISILRQKEIISQERYEYLKSLPKITREIEIGLLEKADSSVYPALQEGIIEAKKDLVGFNKIDEEQIVRVANDAIYINSDVDLKYLQFGDFVYFKPKSEYNIYCKLDKLVIFCKFLEDGNLNIDIKGLDSTDRALELHKDYMVSIIISTIVLLERSGIQSAIDYLSEVCKKYVRRELSVEYYRELNKESLYKFPNITNFAEFGIQYATDADINLIDVTYNYNILRELWSILLEIYSMRKK